MLRGATAAHRRPEEGQFLLATLPPSKKQIRLALGVVVAIVLTFLAMAPFAELRLPQLGEFVVVERTVLVVCNLTISALLFSQFYVAGRPMLVALAITYLFTALMLIANVLTFQGALGPAGLFNAGLQSSNYIAAFGRVGSALGFITYALLRNAGSTSDLSGASTLHVIAWSVVVVVLTVCGLAWAVIAGDAFLPAVFIDGTHADRSALALQGCIIFACYSLALAFVWVRRRSVLDLWIAVMCCAWLPHQLMTAIVAPSRFTVGWYGARGYEVIATLLVLIVLLAETTTLYAKLARSVVRERGARWQRQVAMDAMAVAIAHEIKQPLAAIATDGSAALRFLERSDFGGVQEAIEGIVRSAFRASEVIDGIRALYKKDVQSRASVNLNDVVGDVLSMIDSDLQNQRVSVLTDLDGKLPKLQANRAQLEEVILNLVMNAIDAMRVVTDRARSLRISSEFDPGSLAILVTIEDTGTGIDTNCQARVFEPFFTTKAGGMGIGLAISRAIIESHGGSIHSSANSPYGSIFRITLPSGHI